MAYKYSFQTPDGQTITFDSPTMLTRDQARNQAYSIAEQQALQQRQLESTAEESRGVFGTARDLGLGLAGGAARVAESAGGIAQLSGAEAVGMEVQDIFGDMREGLSEATTPQIQARQQLMDQRLAEVEGEGFLPELGAGAMELLSNPSLLAQFASEQVAQLVPIAKAGRLARETGEVFFREGTKRALSNIGVGGAASAAGALHGADVGMETYDRVYDELVSQGVDPVEANEHARQEGLKDAVQAGGITVATTFAIPGGGAVERALIGKQTANVGRGVAQDTAEAAAQAAGRAPVLRGTARGTLGEAAQEGIEEGSGAYLSNISAIDAGADIDPMAGVGTQTGFGAVLGGTFGLPAGFVQGRRDRRAVEALQQQAQQEAEEQTRQQTERRTAGVMQQQDLPGFEPGALPEVQGPPAPPAETTQEPEFQLEPSGDLGISERQGELDLQPPAAQQAAARGPSGQRELDFRSTQEQLDAIESQLADFNQVFGDLTPSERRQVRRGLIEERNRLQNELILNPRPAEAAAATFEGAQPDLLGFYQPTTETSGAVEAEAETRDQARQRIEAARRRQAGETFGGPQRELELGTPVEPNVLTEERLAEFGLPAQTRRPDRVRANFKKIAQRFEGRDLTDPEQRAQVESELAEIENRDAQWVEPFSQRMRQELQATEQQAEALRAERERIGLERAEREAAPRRELQEDVDFAVERGMQEEQDYRARAQAQRRESEAQTQEEQRRAALRRQLVDRQAERVREQATGRIPLTEEWKSVARTQLRQRQEEAQMRERGLDQMAEQEAADFELDMQYVEDTAPQLEAGQKVAASDFVQQFTEAQAINDPEIIQAIEQEARNQLGRQEWGRLKSGLSNQRRAQQRRLDREARGEVQPEQPDLFAQPETTTEPEVEDAGRPTEDAEQPTPRRRGGRRAARREPEPAADERAAEPSVDVGGEQRTGAAEPSGTPDAGRMGRSGAPASTDTDRAPASDAALEGLPPIALPLQRAITAPTEANTNAVLNQANQDGVLSDEQLEDFRQKIQRGEQARAKAIMHVYNEVRDYEYFTANPSAALSMDRQIQSVKQAAGVTRAATDAEIDAQVREDLGPIDDDTDIVFSRAPFVNKRLSKAEDLKKTFSKLLNRVKNTVEVEVVQSSTDIPDLDIPTNVRGVYYKGKVYIVADAVSEFDFETVLAHEVVGHAGMEQLLGRSAFNNLVNQINKLKSGNARMQRIVEAIRREYTNPQGEYALNDKQEAREIIAHIAESKASYLSDSGIRRAWDNIVRRVRAALSKLGFINPADVLLDQLIYEAAMHVEGGRNALRKSRVFLHPETMAAHTMQRAWDKGYRGFDVEEAGQHVRDIAEGRKEVPDPTQEDIANAPVDDSFYDQVNFSRRAEAARPVNDGFDSLAETRAPSPQNKSNPAKDIKNILSGEWRLRDTFRVRMIDAAATVEDKIMRLYNNGVANAEGIINPMVSYVQSLRSEGLAASVLRAGSLVLDRTTGLWNAVRRDGVPSITDVNAELGKLGDRIGHTNAVNRFHAATIAQRELEIDRNNAELQRKADAQRARGRQKEASQIEEGIVDLYPNLDGQQIAERQRENRELVKLFNQYPELQNAFDMFTKFKNGQIDAMVEAGVVSKEYATELKDNVAYVPFNRLLDDADPGTASGYEVHTSGLMRIGEIKRLRGSPREIDNVIDNMAKLSMWMTQAAVRNHAAREMVRGLREVEAQSPGTGVKEEYASLQQVPAADRPNAISWKDNGKLKFAVLHDPLDAYAWRGTESANIPMLRPFAAIANFLRKGITLSPDFILSQIQQDTFRSYGFGGLKNPARGAVRVSTSWWNIRQDLRRGTFGEENLNRYGIVGQFDYMPEQARQTAEAAALGEELTFASQPLAWLLRWGERNAEASDLAQRKAVYDQTLAETNNETLAFWRASEIINFNRRGTSQFASVLRQVIPFMNAYAQGMNVLGKSIVGRGLSQAEKTQALGVFWGAMMKLSLLSGLYALMNADDEEYVNQPPHIRSRFFLIPTGDDRPALKLAMPADLAFITKALPEAAVMGMMRDDLDSQKTAVELRDAFTTAIFGPNFTPQLIKPSLEAMVNYNFFTGAPIVGMGEQYKQIDEQYRESTSQLARLFANVGISPLIADHLLKGYLGTLGGNALTITDIMYETATGEKKTQRELADYPVARVLFNRTQGSGFKQDFYKLRDEVRAAVGSLNLTRERGDVERAQEIMEDSKRLLQVRTQINRVENTLRKSNNRIKQIQNSNLSPEEKRNRIDREREFQARLAPQIRRMRNYVYDGQ